MKSLFQYLVILFIVSSCNSANPENGSNNNLVENLLEKENISKLIAENHQGIANIKGDYHTYKLYLDSLENNNISSIAFAYDYITTCLPEDSKFQDSIFLLFEDKFYSVANMLTDSFETKYEQLVEQLNDNRKTPELEAFQDNIKFCGIDIFSSEGMYYFDVANDYFYNNFKNRVSAGLKDFLNIRKEEMKQGFSEDAGLLISFEDVHKRVVKWENFIMKYPDNIYTDRAKYFYETYLETLLTGMDNSRTFEYNSESELEYLSPEVKSLFEKIIRENSKSNSSKIISNYYDFWQNMILNIMTV